MLYFAAAFFNGNLHVKEIISTKPHCHNRVVKHFVPLKASFTEVGSQIMNHVRSVPKRPF